MAQRNIDFGTFPDDPDADAIRTAFQKTQENFTELFTATQGQGVVSVNRTPGAGITAFPVTGNVVLSANIACVRIQSNTLSLSAGPGPASNIAIITSGSVPFFIDLPANITNVTNATFSGTITSNILSANSVVSSNTVSATGNISGGNLSTAGVLAVTGNANVGNIGASAGVFTGNVLGGPTLSVTGNANITSNLTANIVTATYLYGDGSNLTNVGGIGGGTRIFNGNSEVNIPSSNSNVFVSVAGTSNVFVISQTGANITGTLNATGNANVGNLGATSVVATTLGGTLTTAAQPNITSVGTLTSLAVTGNLASGNANLGNLVIANYFQGDGSLLTNIPGSTNLSNGNSNVNIPVANGNVNVGVAGNANVVVVTGTGVNVAGTLNTTGKITASILQGEGGNISNIQGANVNGTVSSATTATTAGTVTTAAQPNITSVGTLTSLTVTGNISSGNANLGNLVTANYFQGDGSLLTNIATGVGSYIENGNSNVIVDANSNVRVSSTGNANIFVVTGIGVNVAGTLNATGNANVGNLGATGVIATTLDGSLTTAAQPNITSVGTLTNAAVTGNVTAGNVYANSGTIGASLLTGTLTTASQPNVTSVGTLATLNVSGTSNLGPVGNVTITGGTNGQVLTTNGSGGLSWTTVSGGGGGASIANGTSNVNIPAANGNVNISSNGTANVLVVTSTSANVAGNLGITGYLTASNITTGIGTGGNITGANVISASSFVATGDITGSNLIGNIANGNSVISIPTANGNINLNAGGNATPELIVTTTGINVAGTLNATGNANVGNLGATGVLATTLGGALTTAAQPNITSVGTLTSLSVTGNVTAANVSTTSYLIRSVASGIAAAGTVQSNATAITREVNLVSTVSSGQGVRLPTSVAGMVITIINASANALLVYPHTGGNINNALANVAFSQTANSTTQFIAPNTTNWYTIGSTFA